MNNKTNTTAATELDTATQAKLVARAKSRFEGRKAFISKLAAGNTTLDSNDGYAVYGTVNMEAYVIYTSVGVDLYYGDGTSASFEGSGWGVGGGGMIGAGAGYMAFDAATLKSMGSVSFSIQFAGLSAGGLEIEWWNGGTFVGEMTFAGPNLSLGAFGGSGTFS